MSFVELPRTALQEPLGALVAREAARGPDRLAAKGRAHALTYGALDCGSNRIARAILSRPRNPSGTVALLFAHDAPAIGAILGVLKAGACYVALDPHQSADRHAAVLADCEPALIMCDSAHRARAQELASLACDVLDADALDPAVSDAPPDVAVSPRAPAVICYSSGSTGEPKGVLWDHRGVIHRAMLYIAQNSLASADRAALLQSMAVASSFHRIFGPLLVGAAVMPFDIRSESADGLSAWLAAEEITVCALAASVFRHFAARLTGAERFPKLRHVWLASETVLRSDVELFRARFPASCGLGTTYNTSEAGTLCELRLDPTVLLDGPSVPVGHPVPDKHVLLLDEAGREVAPGEAGEIAVRSEFLAVGYWRRPALDATVFAPDPAGGPARLCRTGDLGRMRPDGCLLHLGRKDTRAKLRGRFVDTAAIETALLDHPGLAGAAISIREDQPGDQRLVAHVVVRRGPAPPVGELQRFVRDRLGDLLVPSTFVFLESLPRTPNGKVDRRALPAPSRRRPALATPYATPHTPVEETVAHLWAAALGLEAVGVDDDFLELGGTSLVAGRITAAVIDRFGVSMPLHALLEARTVGAMARVVVTHLLVARPDAGAQLLAALEPNGGPADAPTDRRRRKRAG